MKDNLTSDKNILYSIQLLRALSCIVVILSHTYFFDGTGAVAINYFFVISGFVIMLSTDNSKFFWTKRLSKILPLYYIMTILTSIFICLLPSLFNSYEFSFTYLLSTFFFIPYEHSGIRQPIMGLGWTLNYEMFFYFIFWISLKINRKYRDVITIIICGALTLLSLLMGKNLSMPFSFWFSSYLLEFCYGIIIYDLFYKKVKHHKRISNRFEKMVITVGSIFIFIVSIVGMSYVRGALRNQEGIINGFLCAMVLSFFVYFESSLKRSNYIVLIAEISYVIYLTHIYPVRLIDKVLVLIGLPGILIAVIALFCSVFVGYLYNQFIEKKVQSYFRKLYTYKMDA